MCTSPQTKWDASASVRGSRALSKQMNGVSERAEASWFSANAKQPNKKKKKKHVERTKNLKISAWTSPRWIGSHSRTALSLQSALLALHIYTRQCGENNAAGARVSIRSRLLIKTALSARKGGGSNARHRRRKPLLSPRKGAAERRKQGVEEANSRFRSQQRASARSAEAGAGGEPIDSAPRGPK